jgi:hypothetical protein
MWWVMVDLGRILVLRERRRDAMRRAETAARQRVEASRANVQSVRETMEAFTAKIRTLEIELLTELMNTEMKVTDFDAFRDTLKAAEDEAKRLSENHRLATYDLMQAERSLDKTRRDRREVESKVNRIGKVQEVLLDQRSWAEMIARDAEMDDIAEVLSGRKGAR